MLLKVSLVEAHEVPEHAARLAARELGHVRVLLLRHHRGAGAEPVGQGDESEARAHPQHQFLRKPRQMHHRDRGAGTEFDREITIRHGIDGIVTKAVEGQVACHLLAPDGEGRAGQGARAQWQAVQALSRIPQALGIAIEHLAVGEQVMTEGDRLRHLHVGEPRHDQAGMLQRQRGERLAQRGEQGHDAVELVAQPQAHVGGHLVVAAAAGVQALAGNAHALGQAGFDVQVHVFEVELPFKGARFDLLGDLRHAALDVGQVASADDALRGQHVGVRQRALNVGLPQAFVEKHAGGVALDQVAHGFAEQSGPSLGLFIELVGCHPPILGAAGPQGATMCSGFIFPAQAGCIT